MINQIVNGLAQRAVRSFASARRPVRSRRAKRPGPAASGLLGLEALLRLVDDEDAALAAHQLVVTVPTTQRPERIADLHDATPLLPGHERP